VIHNRNHLSRSVALVAVFGLVLALGMASSVGPASAGSNPFLFDDFDDGDADGWTPDDPTGGIFGDSTFEVVDGRYEMSTPVFPPVDFVLGVGSRWDPSVHNRYKNGVYRATVRCNNADSNAGIVIRGNNAATKGYLFFVSNARDVVGIHDLSKGYAVNLAEEELEIEEGVSYVVEGTAHGKNLSVTVRRADGTGDVARVSARDTAWERGAIALVVYNTATSFGGSGGSLSASFDDVSIGKR